MNADNLRYRMFGKYRGRICRRCRNDDRYARRKKKHAEYRRLHPVIPKEPKKPRKPRPTLAERLLNYTVTPSGCWEWNGNRNHRGYGKFDINGRRYRAHRVAWERAHGPIPPGMFVCHHCDNPPCINLTHLFLGTPMDNVHDAMRKGRMRRL